MPKKNQPLKNRRQREEKAEQHAHDASEGSGEELGRVGEKKADQVYSDMLARGELTRGEREMAHGEFGDAAYDEMQRTPGHAADS